MRTSGRTALLTKPNLHRAGPGGRKEHIQGEAKGLSLAPCPPTSTALRWGALRFACLDGRALLPQR